MVVGYESFNKEMLVLKYNIYIYLWKIAYRLGLGSAKRVSPFFALNTPIHHAHGYDTLIQRYTDTSIAVCLGFVQGSFGVGSWIVSGVFGAA